MLSWVPISKLSPPKAATQLQARLRCISAGRDAPFPFVRPPAASLHGSMQNAASNIYAQPGSEHQEPASSKRCWQGWGCAHAGTTAFGAETLSSQHQQERGYRRLQSRLSASKSGWSRMQITTEHKLQHNEAENRLYSLKSDLTSICRRLTLRQTNKNNPQTPST